MRTALALLALLLTALPAASAPAPLLLAAASDLQPVMPDLLKAYGHPEVTATFGSSGKLFTQIVAGAPYDAFFSADAAYAQQVEAKGLALPGTRHPYATGHLVLWSRPGGPDPQGGLAPLAGAGIGHVAIANPAHAPYGRAAEAALRHAGVYDAVKPKLVLGENVAQAAQFAARGGADVALVSGTLLASLAGGRSWPVPDGFHAPITQVAVGLKRTAHPDAVKALLAWVNGPAGRQVLAKHGLTAP